MVPENFSLDVRGIDGESDSASYSDPEDVPNPYIDTSTTEVDQGNLSLVRNVLSHDNNDNG